MNLHHLRYFVTLAKLEHFTKAAEELGLTQPSLSHAMAALEEELGVPLFEKAGRNIRLTKYGSGFLEDVISSLQVLDSGINRLRLISRGEGTVELAFLRTLGRDLVPRLVSEFLREHREKPVRFNLSTDSGLTADLIAGLKSRRYDLIFCSRPDDEPELDFVPVAAQELVVVVSSGHPLARKRAVDLVETLPYPQIIFKKKSGLRGIIDGLFHQIGASPRVSLEVEEDQVAAGLAAHGFGLAVVPNMDFLGRMNLKVLKLKSPRWERQFYLASLQTVYRPPVVADFRDFVLQKTEKHRLFLDGRGLVKTNQGDLSKT